MDLKKYMDSVGDRDGLGPGMVKVGLPLTGPLSSLALPRRGNGS